MEQYLVTAFDYTDENALERRMAARPAHLEGAKRLKANNQLVLAGAMLNEEGKMTGSSMIVQFEKREELDAWLAEDPYVKEKVWEKVDVKPFRIASI